MMTRPKWNLHKLEISAYGDIRIYKPDYLRKKVINIDNLSDREIYLSEIERDD
jgi:hypothetical protein